MSDEARTVLAAFRRATQTSAAQHAATWAQLQARIAADDAAPSVEDDHDAPAPIRSPARPRAVAIGVAVAAAIALAVWAWSWRHAAVEADTGARSQAVDDARRSPTLGHVTAADDPAPPERADAIPTPPSAMVAPEPMPLQTPKMPGAAPSVAPRSPASAPAGNDALAREVALMRAAREAVLAGTLDRAVTLTDTHAREFPRGKLAHERWALRIDLFCRLDRSDAARATALAFASAHPDSTLAAERRTTPCPHKP